MQNLIGLLCLVTLIFSSCGDKATQASTDVKPASIAKKAIEKKSGEAIKINISKANAKKGEEVCVSFVAADFNDIMGYQHSIQFDSKSIEYTKTRNYGLPNLNEGNFGATKASEGSINFLWFDMNVKGVSLPDQANVFDICFKAIGGSGTKSQVSISGSPTKIEVVGPQKQKMQLTSNPGTITID